jgi:hypothetical protein
VRVEPSTGSVVGSAAGPIMRADDVWLVLEAPDKQVRRMLKKGMRRLRREARTRWRKDIFPGGKQEGCVASGRDTTRTRMSALLTFAPRRRRIVANSVAPCPMSCFVAVSRALAPDSQPG